MPREDVYLARVRLGVTLTFVADLCGVSRRTVERWESGATQIDTESEARLRALADATERILADYADKFADGGIFATFLPAARDSVYIEHPNLPCPVPASWHHMLTARLAQTLPHLQVVFSG